MKRRAKGVVVLLVVLVATPAVAGCASQGHRAKLAVSATSGGEASQENAWSGSGDAPAASARASSASAPASSASSASAPASSAPPPPPRPGCSLVCNIANRGRVPAADEARFTAALAASEEALRACVPGRLPMMTLRFDSQGTMTYFGADVDDASEGAVDDSCIDAACRQKPSLTFSGPSTVRCAERCAR